jgi:hypothetical protein
VIEAAVDARAIAAAFSRPEKHNLMFLARAADAIASARQSIWMKPNLVF